MMKLCDVLRPLMRIFPRQSMAILGYLGAGYAHDADWKTVWPRYRSYFDRQLQCLVTADLTEWGGRSCYYWARFFDVTHQAVVRRYLSPGDTYIDVGANVGYQSLYATRLVGPNGLVLSFEPNPPTYAILTSHVGINRLKNCRTFPIALSDARGEAILNQLEEHSGTSTLRPQASVLRSVNVPMEPGDDVLKDIAFSGRTFMKIDVEGLELRVLKGLRETLDRVTTVSVEVTDDWLVQQGGSAAELYAFMKEAGFQPLLPKIRWQMGLFNPRLDMQPLAHPLAEQHDVLFVRKV